jgi:hypothetical protein
LLSSILKKSLLSLGYILILIPNLRSGSNVLEQREIIRSKKKDKLDLEIRNGLRQITDIDTELARVELNASVRNSDRIRELTITKAILKDEVEQNTIEVNKIKNSQHFKHF